MAQTYTSAATSVNSSRLPAVFHKIPLRHNGLLLDFGCGRYTDHIRSALPHTVYLPLDPYNQPDDVNGRTMYYVRNAVRVQLPVDVVCSNVLNVIDDEEEIQRIAGFIRYVVRVSGGTGYITVYEGNRSGTGRQTGPDQYQRNEPLREYLKYFPGAEIRSGMIVVY